MGVVGVGAHLPPVDRVGVGAVVGPEVRAQGLQHGLGGLLGGPVADLDLPQALPGVGLEQRVGQVGPARALPQQEQVEGAFDALELLHQTGN